MFIAPAFILVCFSLVLLLQSQLATYAIDTLTIIIHNTWFTALLTTPTHCGESLVYIDIITVTMLVYMGHMYSRSERVLGFALRIPESTWNSNEQRKDTSTSYLYQESKIKMQFGSTKARVY